MHQQYLIGLQIVNVTADPFWPSKKPLIAEANNGYNTSMAADDHVNSSSRGAGFQKSSWVVLGVSVFFLALFVAFLLIHLVTPSDGARLQPGTRAWTSEGVIVTPLREQAEALRAGDLVIAVDGRTLESWAQAGLSLREGNPRWEPGQSLV